MHYLYCPIEYNGAPFIAKITIEEYDVDGKRRAYNAQRIKMSSLPRAHFSSLNKDAKTRKIRLQDDEITIADLFSLVKQFDKDFSYQPTSAVINEDGTPKIMYHGTKAEFTVFDRSKRGKKVSLNVMGDGNYFTESKAGAEHYGGNVIGAYISIKRPYVFNSKAYNTVADQIAAEFGVDRSSIRNDQVSVFLKEKDYDGVVLKDGENIIICNAFDSEQIKSATDNIGTFDKSNPDIRYSIKMSSSAREALESNPELKLIYQNMQNQMQLSEGYVPDGKRIHKFATELCKNSGTTLSATEVENDLQEIYKVLASIEDSEGYEYAWDSTVELAQKMLDNSTIFDASRTEQKELRGKLNQYFRGKRYYLSPEMRSEIEKYTWRKSSSRCCKRVFPAGMSFPKTSIMRLVFNSYLYLPMRWLVKIGVVITCKRIATPPF